MTDADRAYENAKYQWIDEQVSGDELSEEEAERFREDQAASYYENFLS